MASFGPPSYQDPDEAREWALDRAHDPEWRPPVEDDGQQVWGMRCANGAFCQPERYLRRITAAEDAAWLDARSSCGPHAVVPVPADPMVVVGLELPEGES